MKRRSGKTNRAIVLAGLLMSSESPNQMANSGPSTSLIQSQRVARILKEAQHGKRPIRITEFEGTRESLYSGTVDLNDPNEIKVSINRNLPLRTAENNLVHELFHVIFFNEGFRYTAGSFRFNVNGNVGGLYR